MKLYVGGFFVVISIISKTSSVKYCFYPFRNGMSTLASLTKSQHRANVDELIDDCLAVNENSRGTSSFVTLFVLEFFVLTNS